MGLTHQLRAVDAMLLKGHYARTKRFFERLPKTAEPGAPTFSLRTQTVFCVAIVEFRSRTELNDGIKQLLLGGSSACPAQGFSMDDDAADSWFDRFEKRALDGRAGLAWLGFPYEITDASGSPLAGRPVQPVARKPSPAARTMAPFAALVQPCRRDAVRSLERGVAAAVLALQDDAGPAANDVVARLCDALVACRDDDDLQAIYDRTAAALDELPLRLWAMGMHAITEQIWLQAFNSNPCAKGGAKGGATSGAARTAAAAATKAGVANAEQKKIIESLSEGGKTTGAQRTAAAIAVQTGEATPEQENLIQSLRDRGAKGSVLGPKARMDPANLVMVEAAGVIVLGGDGKQLVVQSDVNRVFQTAYRAAVRAGGDRPATAILRLQQKVRALPHMALLLVSGLKPGCPAYRQEVVRISEASKFPRKLIYSFCATARENALKKKKKEDEKQRANAMMT